MDVYIDTSTLSMDTHLFPSAFGNAEYLHSDDSHVELMHSLHGTWNPGPTFNQEMYYGDMNSYGPLMLYDAHMSCGINVAPNYQIEPSHAVERRLPTSNGQKRKSQSSSDAVASKRQKHSARQRSSVSGSSSPRSTNSDSTNPTAPSSRAHYAVEKRYRATLNDRYATLARLVSRAETQKICRIENKQWEVPSKLDSSGSSSNNGPCKRQSKTTTLSVAIDTIALLDRGCMRKVKELQSLRSRLDSIASSVSADCDCDNE
ncbi:hypothetical protein DOTSEDRAFT_68352 [Dothistroma septosporum NZE10]|uniref:BHLH domain-containing protein n=1 Tax=Dothistroma septosporum (strain NZE10 / CBS 128990) TaxID=675120 RepID=N1Q2T3_DOTSN|nr:hypothetical protein DOTSEDRAFT_68352 [Dothistroma septosporum NZE10]